MPGVDTAVILAAGSGLRLRSTGHELPKGFLRLGSLPIVEESILRLKSVGCRRVIIVTGYLAEHYELLAARYGSFIETVHNPHFAQTGSLDSLACARPRLTSDFLLVESDLVYERAAIAVCLESPFESVLLLSGLTGAGDEVFARTEGHLIVGLSKDPSQLGGPADGEFVGISRLTLSSLDQLLKLPQRSALVHYGAHGLAQLAKTAPLHCVLRPDLCWAEIDDEAHYRRAVREIYPIIARDDLRWMGNMANC